MLTELNLNPSEVIDILQQYITNKYGDNLIVEQVVSLCSNCECNVSNLDLHAQVRIKERQA